MSTALPIATSAQVRADELLEGLRRAGIVRVDLLAAYGGGPATSALVAARTQRAPVTETRAIINANTNGAKADVN